MTNTDYQLDALTRLDSMLNQYQFHIVARSGTCLNDIEQLLQDVLIPGYPVEFNHCEHQLGV